MNFILHAIWRKLGHSASTRWLACAIIGAIGAIGVWFGNPRYSLAVTMLLGAGLALLAYGPLEYFGRNRELTSEGGVKISAWDFFVMLLYFSIAIVLVAWFTI